MQTALAPIFSDMLVRYQQTAIRQTGRRPVTYLRSPIDDDLMMPGCTRPGCAFWQPIAWPKGQPRIGKAGKGFHQSILDYLTLCQFLEIRFKLPVAAGSRQLSFLFNRGFETRKNTLSAPPARALEEAQLYQREHPQWPLGYCMAATCDAGEPILLMIAAEDGQAYILRAESDVPPLCLKLGLDRLLPKLQFVYEI